MGRILLRAYFLRRNLFCAGTALGFLAIGSMRGWSAPEWWSGTPGDAVKAAIQGKKNLIFYFRTELGEDCIEMEKQTWPKISADDFKNKFIWVKVDPGEESGRNVFEYFDVFQTPEIVIARPGTNQPEEVDRINGFVSSDTLKQRIAGVKFDAPAKPPAAAGPKGKAPPEPETSAVTLFTADFGEKGKPIALDGKIFDPYLNLVGGVKVDPKEGIGETPALSVGSFRGTALQLKEYPSAAIRINLSNGLDKTELIEGKLALTMRAKVSRAADDKKLFDFAAIVVQSAKNKTVPIVEDVKSRKNCYRIPIHKDDTYWRKCEMETDVFNFHESKVYLLIWVNRITDQIFVDDITVELLPEGGTTKGPKLPDPGVNFDPPMPHVEDWHFIALDKNKDGRIDLKREVSKAEIDSYKSLQRIDILAKDKNHDGFIDEDEW